MAERGSISTSGQIPGNCPSHIGELTALCHGEEKWVRCHRNSRMARERPLPLPRTLDSGRVGCPRLRARSSSGAVPLPEGPGGSGGGASMSSGRGI